MINIDFTSQITDVKMALELMVKIQDTLRSQLALHEHNMRKMSDAIVGIASLYGVDRKLYDSTTVMAMILCKVEMHWMDSYDVMEFLTVIASRSACLVTIDRNDTLIRWIKANDSDCVAGDWEKIVSLVDTVMFDMKLDIAHKALFKYISDVSTISNVTDLKLARVLLSMKDRLTYDDVMHKIGDVHLLHLVSHDRLVKLESRCDKIKTLRHEILSKLTYESPRDMISGKSFDDMDVSQLMTLFCLNGHCYDIGTIYAYIFMSLVKDRVALCPMTSKVIDNDVIEVIKGIAEALISIKDVRL